MDSETVAKELATVRNHVEELQGALDELRHSLGPRLEAVESSVTVLHQFMQANSSLLEEIRSLIGGVGAALQAGAAPTDRPRHL